MKFYTQQHKFYCGIDLHARTLYVCILNQAGETVLHRNMKTDPALFLKVIASYREDLVVAVECIFTWYWLADLCVQQGLPFVLGHALYMKAICAGSVEIGILACCFELVVGGSDNQRMGGRSSHRCSPSW